MSGHQDKESSAGYGNLVPVAWSILVMGLSLAIVIVLYVWFGHVGPSFSEDVMEEQQTFLREHFKLPPAEVITDPKVLLTPPSLRGNSADNNSAS
ncbi:MAG TPA: hypothetical protein VFH04_03110 [Nitrososphaeraceae archaeon]|jgi:hypothetical protein|nr:hypothetical protein [Nitrososphaeraceae archaeon]